jgi:AAA+ superfamily predicted ATPase
LPLPTPNKGESKKKFLERCMGNPTSVKDFPQAAQRFAVCQSQSERRGKSVPLDQIQSLIFAKSWFQSKEDAQMSLQSRGYTDVQLKETDRSYIFTQQLETSFIPKSFETIDYGNGIAAVCGTRVPMLKKNFDSKKPFSEATLGDYDEVLHHSARRESLAVKDLEEYFGVKYSQLVKVVDGVIPFRSNLFRFALNGIASEEDVLVKGVTNYDLYDDETRTPVEYISFSTGNENHEGIFQATLLLEVEEEKLVASVSPGWAGSISIKYFAIQKDTIAKFQNQITNFIKENNFLKGKKLLADGSFIKLPNVGWDDIILSDEIKHSIQKNVVEYIDRIPEIKAKGLPVKRGLLIHGDPGNGKTYLGKVLANNVDCTFIWIPFAGVSGEDMSYKDIFEMARELSPSIVLMEDLASQGGMDRREYGNGYVSSNLGLLLNVLEGVEENDGVITIATENYVDNLDIALRNRPGRFDIILHMPNPGFDQREQILANLLPEFPGGRIQALAHKSGGMSCAHLRELAIRLLLEDEPIDKDTGIIEDMIKTFGIEVVIEEKTPHTGEDHIVAAHISEE